MHTLFVRLYPSRSQQGGKSKKAEGDRKDAEVSEMNPLLSESEDFNEDDIHSVSDHIELGIKHSEDEMPDLITIENLIDIAPIGKR